MLYAVMSDAHANPAALELALADAHELGCLRYVFAGDITGYGHDARRTLRIVRENFDVIIMGNHDAVCCGMDWRASAAENPNYDTDRAQAAELTDDELEWLCGLPVVHSENGIAFAHGDFTNPKGWRYVMEPNDVEQCMRVRDEHLLFCGHTHVAAVWEYHETGCVKRLEVPPSFGGADIVWIGLGGGRHLVNCGSVGCPRRGACAEYAVLDAGARAVALRRLPFA